MGLDLTVCNLNPSDLACIILLIEYTIVLFIISYNLSVTIAFKKDNQEVYIYHILCITTCVLRESAYTYKLWFQGYSSNFAIIILVSPLPFLIGINLLVGTWMKRYLVISNYAQDKFDKMLFISRLLLIIWNFLVTISVIIFSVIIGFKYLNCNYYTGNIIVILDLSLEFIVWIMLITTGLILLNKIKQKLNVYPQNLLIWIILVIFLSFCRSISLIFQITGVLNKDTDDTNAYSIYYLLILNFFEIIPILVYSKAIIISCKPLLKNNDVSCESSMSSLINL